MTGTAEPQNWQDVFFTSEDGLRLYARRYPAPGSRRRPLLCLSGLTHNSRDFHVLASYLADPRNPEAREVLALDYRGRGRSAWDRNWRNYSISVELKDALDLLAVTSRNEVAVLGTSRGGLVAMAMACLRPTAMGAVILNDIGPVIEREGLVRLVAYVGRVPLPPTWEEAARLVQQVSERSFPGVPEPHWAEIARQWFNDEHGRPAPAYDPALSRAVSLIDGPIPALWPQFSALYGVPALVVRGEHSDVLSPETLSDMRLRHPSLTAVTARGQGHAPLLRDRATVVAIAEFLARTDPAAAHPAPPARVQRLRRSA